MSNYTCGDHMWTLDWESIAALCPDAWKAFAKECVGIILPAGNTEYSANDWLYSVCEFLQYDIITDECLDCAGETYEGMARRIADLWQAVATEFERKTQAKSWWLGKKAGLTLYPHAKVSEGEQEDDIRQGQHYFELDGTHVISPAFHQFKKDYPAARPEEKTWTEGA